jgi:hypothetical protein
MNLRNARRKRRVQGLRAELRDWFSWARNRADAADPVTVCGGLGLDLDCSKKCRSSRKHVFSRVPFRLRLSNRPHLQYFEFRPSVSRAVFLSAFPPHSLRFGFLEVVLRADFGRGVSSRTKREGATDVAPSIETVARCDGASSLALAGYLSFGLSANLALSERYAAVAVKGKQGVRGYPQAG